MKTIWNIADREFRSLIVAPIGWVVMAAFLVLSGVFFIAPLQQNLAHIRYVVQNSVILLVFLLPAVTMRTLAEEKKQGTIELLMTSPVTEGQVVVGKFLGVLLYYMLLLYSTIQFVFVLGWVRKSGANPIFPTYTGLVLCAASLVLIAIAALREDRRLTIGAAVLVVGTLIAGGFAVTQMGEWGPVVTGYIGLLMLGAVYLAIGVLMSGLTRNQIIAWVSTAAVLLMMTILIGWITRDNPPVAPVLEANPSWWAYVTFGLGWVWYVISTIFHTLSLSNHLQNFVRGVLDLRDVVLYLSIVVVTLFFSTRSLATTRAA